MDKPTKDLPSSPEEFGSVSLKCFLYLQQGNFCFTCSMSVQDTLHLRHVLPCRFICKCTARLMWPKETWLLAEHLFSQTDSELCAFTWDWQVATGTSAPTVLFLCLHKYSILWRSWLGRNRFLQPETAEGEDEALLEMASVDSVTQRDQVFGVQQSPNVAHQSNLN